MEYLWCYKKKYGFTWEVDFKGFSDLGHLQLTYEDELEKLKILKSDAELYSVIHQLRQENIFIITSNGHKLPDIVGYMNAWKNR